MDSTELLCSSTSTTKESGINKETSRIAKGVSQININRTASEKPSLYTENKSQLARKLASLECIFTFEKNDFNHEKIISTTLQKLKEDSEEEEHGEKIFKWYTFTLTLILCNEYFLLKEYNESMNKLKECESLINTDVTRGVYSDLFCKIKDALEYIILSCKCHILHNQKNEIEVQRFLYVIPNYEKMTNACKAAIYGIRGIILMNYSIEGFEESKVVLEKALELDPEQAEWHFLLGKCLSRIRHVNSSIEIPEQKELTLLETAVSMTRNPFQSIYLAQAYQEAASRAFHLSKNNPVLKDKLTQMNKKAIDLYEEALNLIGEESCNVNVRCAKGFAKFPHPYNDLERSKQLIENALKIDPDNLMANHVAGHINERTGDIDNALVYYTIASEKGVFGARMDLIKLKYKQDKTLDIISELQAQMEEFTDKPYKEELLCQLGAIFFFMKDDLISAVKYWRQVTDTNPDSKKLKFCKCCIMYMIEPFNIYEVMVDEAQFFLKNHKYKSDEEKKFIQNVIIDFHSKVPELEVNPLQSKRNKIMQKCPEIHKYFTNQGQRGRNLKMKESRYEVNDQRERGNSSKHSDTYNDWRSSYNRQERSSNENKNKLETNWRYELNKKK